MLGPTHRLFGGLAGVAAASTGGQSTTLVIFSGLVAMNTAHGWASPDIDQTKPWVKLRKTLPGSVDQLLNHRHGISHWWGLVVLGYWGITLLPPEATWPATALLVGWASHLVGDLIFGDLALFPWGGPKWGLGLDTGGFLETGRAKVKTWLLWGKKRERRIIPFGPTRVLIVAATVWVLLGTPSLTGVIAA